MGMGEGELVTSLRKRRGEAAQTGSADVNAAAGRASVQAHPHGTPRGRARQRAQKGPGEKPEARAAEAASARGFHTEQKKNKQRRPIQNEAKTDG